MANFLEFRNDTMDSKLRANTRSPIFPSLSFFVAYTNVARSWHVVLLHVHRLRSGWDNRRVSYRAYRRLLLPRNIVRASRWI